MTLRVGQDGSIACLYTEAIDLQALGPMHIRRASHVEPDEQGWWVDLSPVGGPRLGPFGLRSGALAAEGRWLEDNTLGAAIQERKTT